MMKILEAFGEPVSYGGQESFVINFLNQMDRCGMLSGAEIDFLTPYYCDSGVFSSIAGKWGGEIFSLGKRFRPGGMRTAVFLPLKRFLDDHRYDLIHIHSGSSSMLTIYAWTASRSGIPRIIVHSHSTGFDDTRHRLIKAVTSRSLRTYPTDWCSCTAEAGEWRFPGDVCTDRLRVIPDGIDAERFRFDENIRQRIRAGLIMKDRSDFTAEDMILIGCVGRLEPQKNQSFLIDLLADIHNLPGGSRYRLLLAGDGRCMKDLKLQADRLGLSEDVIFTGALENVSEYYQAMDVLAVPSLFEGFGIAAVEGQAAGLDIIVSTGVSDSVDITKAVTRLPLTDKGAWISSLTAHHSRHACNADLISESEYDIRKTAEIIGALYGL